MKTDIKFIHDMLVKLSSDLDDVKSEQVEQRVVLEEHQRRSLANEKAVELLAQSIKPIETHVLVVNFTVKILSVIGGMLLLAATIWQAVK